MNSIKANDKITAKSVRLVANNESNVMNITEARKIADQEGFDLVQINEADVPVVKLVDLNKYLYELAQIEKENKKKQRNSVIQCKELQFSSETQENDLNVKARSANKFLSEGKHVRFVMKMPKRRNQQVQEQCILKMKEFCTKFIDVTFVKEVQVNSHDVVCVIKKN